MTTAETTKQYLPDGTGVEINHSGIVFRGVIRGLARNYPLPVLGMLYIVELDDFSRNTIPGRYSCHIFPESSIRKVASLN